ADRALSIFAGQDVDLAIAALPEGMDPFDLLIARGAEPFVHALTSAIDALEFKLNQVLSRPDSSGVEGKRLAVDAVLSVIAQAPDMPGQAAAMKRELMVTRIAQRLGIKEETVWDRLQELRRSVRKSGTSTASSIRKDSAQNET